MRLYKARINDYGHGDYETATIAATSIQNAYDVIIAEGHRVDIEDIYLHNIVIPKTSKIIDIS